MTQNLKRWVAGELLHFVGVTLVKAEHELHRLFKHPSWRDVWSEKELAYLEKRHSELSATREKIGAFRDRRCN